MYDPNGDQGTVMDEIEALLDEGDFDGIRNHPDLSEKEAQRIIDDELYYSHMAENEDSYAFDKEGEEA